MKAAVSRQKQLVERYENVRKNILKAGGRPMSEKEKEWIREINELSVSLREAEQEEPGQLAERVKTVWHLVHFAFAMFEVCAMLA
jgi:nucleoporin NUP82